MKITKIVMALSALFTSAAANALEVGNHLLIDAENLQCDDVELEDCPRRSNYCADGRGLVKRAFLQLHFRIGDIPSLSGMHPGACENVLNQLVRPDGQVLVELVERTTKKESRSSVRILETIHVTLGETDIQLAGTAFMPPKKQHDATKP